jgi:hypothetical protein
MLDEATFNKWCLLNWEAKGVSLNSYWGLGYKYVCLMFNTESTAWKVLQYSTWNIAGSLAYVQSWRDDFNLEDRGQANYPLWIKFLVLPTDLRPFVDLFANQFGKVLIPNGKRNSF